MKTAEEWGRLAVSLPGWRWMLGMTCGGSPVEASPFLSPITDEWLGWWGLSSSKYDDVWVDPDDPATAGCLLVLAGAPHRLLPTVEAWLSGAHVEGMTLGRACIADVRDQWGRWPGGEK